MLCIEKIRYKNILSVGNQFIEVDLNSHKTTILRGSNGQGKSLLITALIFGLYGKSNRKTTKKQLVNSINKKDCLVEIEFTNQGKKYKIRRGISPNIFEIYVNDTPQEELSAVRDQQKYLEQNILKMSYKTFMQVVVLGSSNYIPFMELSSADRRDLVEELLDIKIFSLMNLILKDKIKYIESKVSKFRLDEAQYDSLISNQKKYIDKIRTSGLITISKKQKESELIENEISALLNETLKITNEIEELNHKLNEITFNPKKLKSFLSFQGKIEQKALGLREDLDFFDSNSTCPTCTQNVDDVFKKNKLKELNEKLIELDQGKADILIEIENETKREKEFSLISKSISLKNSKLESIQKEISFKNRQIQNLNQESIEIQNEIENQDEALQTLKNLESKLNRCIRYRSKFNEMLEYFEFSQYLMKDNGIKTKIIENYLPVMNTQINKYLQLMDLYINFNLDNEFNEIIQTPIHEDFSYGSFSEGEKQRINLSLLLAWRDIARMKNSINCNLMIFDETLDSSLDGTGIEDILKIINYIVKDSNIIIISHRDGYDDRFERLLEVKKVNGFTKIFS